MSEKPIVVVPDPLAVGILAKFDKAISEQFSHLKLIYKTDASKGEEVNPDAQPGAPKARPTSKVVYLFEGNHSAAIMTYQSEDEAKEQYAWSTITMPVQPGLDTPVVSDEAVRFKAGEDLGSGSIMVRIDKVFLIVSYPRLEEGITMAQALRDAINATVAEQKNK